MDKKLIAKLVAGIFGTAPFLAAISQPALAAGTDIATSPLANRRSSDIKPNIMLVLDDSGSMQEDYMPESASGNNSAGPGYRSHLCNTVYYNPAITNPLLPLSPYLVPRSETGADLNIGDPASFASAYDNGYWSYDRIGQDGGVAGRTDLGADQGFGGSYDGAADAYPGKLSYRSGQPAYYWKYLGSATVTPDFPNFGVCKITGSFGAPTTGICAAASALTAADTTAIAVGSITGTADDAACAAADATKPRLLWQKIVVGIASGPSGSDETLRFANWYSYYRSRMQMTKSAIGRAFLPLIAKKKYRAGFITIAPQQLDAGAAQASVYAYDAGAPQNSKFLEVRNFDSTDLTTNQPNRWFNILYAQRPNGATPLREGLSRVGRYYAGKNDGPNTGMIPSSAADPVQYACQQNFAILTTDGYWDSPASSIGGFKLDYTVAMDNQDGNINELDVNGQNLPIGARPIYDGTITSTATTTDAWNTYGQPACNFYMQSNTQILQSTAQFTQSTLQALQGTSQGLQSTNQNLRSTAQNLQSTAQVNRTTTQNLRSTNQNQQSTNQYLRSTAQVNRTTTQNLRSTNQNLRSTAQNLQYTTQLMEIKLQQNRSTHQEKRSTNQYRRSTAQVNRTTTQNLKSTNQNLRSTNQYLRNTAQVRRTTTQNLKSTNQNLRSTNQYLRNTAQVRRTTTQNLSSTNQNLRSTSQLLGSTTQAFASTSQIQRCNWAGTTCVAAANCTEVFEQTTCPAPTVTGPTAVASCTATSASVGNSWVTTTCPAPVVTGPAAMASCSAVAASAGNSWVATTCASAITTNVPIGVCTATSASSGNSWVTTTCPAPVVTTNVPQSAVCAAAGASAGNSWVTTTCPAAVVTNTPQASCAAVAASAGNSWVATTCASVNTTNVGVQNACAAVSASSGNSWVTTTCPAASITTNVPIGVCTATSASSGNSWVTTTCPAPVVTTNVPQSAVCAAVSASAGNSWVTTTCPAAVVTNTPQASCAAVAASAGNSWVATTCASVNTTNVGVQNACAAVSASSGNSWVTTTCPAASITTNVPIGVCTATSASSGNSWVTTTCPAPVVTTNVPQSAVCAAVSASAGNSWVTTTCPAAVVTNTPQASCAAVAASAGNSWVATTCASVNTTNVGVQNACAAVSASSGNSWVTTTCPAASITTNVPIGVCTATSASSGNSWVTTTCSILNAGPTPIGTCTPVSASSGNSWVTTTCATSTISSTPASVCTPVAASAGNSWVTTICASVATGPTPVATCTAVAASAGNSWVATTCGSAITTNVPIAAACSATSASSGNSWVTTTCPAASVTTNVPAASCAAVTASAGNSWVTTTCSVVVANTPVASCAAVAASAGNSWVATTCASVNTTNVGVQNACAAVSASSGNSWVTTTCPAAVVTTNVPIGVCTATSASSGNSWVTTTCPAPVVTTNVPQAAVCAAVSASAGNSWVTTTCPAAVVTNTPQASCAAVAASAGNSWVATTCASVNTTNVPQAAACAAAGASSGNSWVTTTCPAAVITTNVPVAACAAAGASSGNSWVTTTCPAAVVTTNVPVAACAAAGASSGNSWVTTTCPAAVVTGPAGVASCTAVGASSGNSWVTTTCPAPVVTGPAGVASCSAVAASSGNGWVTTTCAASTTTNVPVAACTAAGASAGNSWLTTTCDSLSSPLNTPPVAVQTCSPVVPVGPDFVSTDCSLPILGAKNQYQTQIRSKVDRYSGSTVVGSTAYPGSWPAPGAWNDLTLCLLVGDLPPLPNGGAAGTPGPTDPASPSYSSLDAGCTGWPCTHVDNTVTGGSSNGLADVAQYYYKNDLRPAGTTGFNGLVVSDNKVFSNSSADPTEGDKGKWQHMTTFTMGLGVSGTIPYNALYTNKPLLPVTEIFQKIRCQDGSNAPLADPNDCSNWPVPVPRIPGPPVVDVAQGTRVDDLWHAAVNGRGKYFSATDPDAVFTGLQAALEAINAQSGSGSGATTSTQDPVPGNDLTFAASFRTVEWTGNLTAQQLNTDPNSCEVDVAACTATGGRTVGTRCGVGLTGYVCNHEGTTRAGSIWSAQDKLDGQVRAFCDSRSIYLLRVGATDNMVPFTWNSYACDGPGNPTGAPGTGLNAGEQAFFTSTAGSAYSSPFPMSAWSQFINMTDGSAATFDQKTAAQGANLVNFLRGQRGRENFDRGSDTRLFRNRLHVLGDIVGSQPRYVRSPNAQFTDTGYALYKAKAGIVDRPTMLYVGANDGMMHAFKVGSSVTDPEGGTEAWAVIPSPVLPNLYRLGDFEYSATHTFYVDSTPSAGDVYDRHQTVPDICAGTTDATVAVNCWKTVLVGGLGSGGRGYYAMDVTIPTSPKALWEFKWSDTCYAAGTPATHYADCHIGLTFGSPLITKLGDGTWVALVTSGMNNVNTPAKAGDGVGYLYVLDVITGKILHKISTGAGSAATASVALTGTLTLNGTTLVTGSGTLFASELVAGQTLIVNGRTRVVQAVADDTNLTVSVAFPASANGTFAGTSVVGTGSSDFAYINAYVENYLQNNTTERVYGGDRLGNVWRINMAGLTATGGTADVARLATLLDPNGNPQPVTSTPQMMNVGAAQTRMVYVGTGRYLGESDLSDTQVQTIYGLGEDLSLLSTSVDYISNGYTVLPTSGLTLRQQLNQVALTTVYAADPDPVTGLPVPESRTAASPVCSAEAAAAGIGCVGWYADLTESGERVNLDMRLVLGSLNAVTNVTNLTACDSGGNSWTNTFDAATGAGVVGSDGTIGRYMAGAVAVGVSLIRGRSGRIMSIITKSDGTQQVTDVPTQQAAPLGRRSGWRDLLNDN